MRPSFTARSPGRLTVWVLVAMALGVAPLAFNGGLGVSMLSQIGIATVACLSYNILLGQGGMLSFGHAVYTGLAAFVAIHALKAIGAGLPLPVSAVPLVGGFAGLACAAALGWVTTRKAGTTFAMITLGLGEMVFASALMVPEFFGGEAGVSANRVVGKPVMGISFGPQIEVYYLIAAYTAACVAAMQAFTGTPLGRMLNAVRDNPERVEFIGYSSQRVRYFSFVIAGFFAGVAGGMYALSFEIATAELVGAGRSGSYLLFTFVGGATYFFGPVIGAVLMVIATVLLSAFTKAWLLYLGLVFVLMVMCAPGGFASLIAMNLRVAAFGKFKGLLGAYAALALSGALMFAGVAAMIEMTYHLQQGEALGPRLRFIGVELDAKGTASWSIALALGLTGGALFALACRRFGRRWGEIQDQIEAAILGRSANPAVRAAKALQ